MEKILVPIDFSKYSDRALDVARTIAKKRNALIHLFHCSEIPDQWPDLFAINKDFTNLKKIYHENIQRKLTEIQESFEKEGIESRFEIFDGLFLDNINYMVESLDPHLIVMGSHGAKHKEEVFLGSNTQKVVRKVHSNILVIKEENQTFNPKKVLFVSNLDLKEKVVFKKFLEFIKPFGVEEVHLLTIDTSSFFSQPTLLIKEAMKSFKEIAKEYEVEGHLHSDTSIEAGVRHFSNEQKIDLIGISHISRHPLKRIFLGSNVEMLVNRSKIPVLSLDFNY